LAVFFKSNDVVTILTRTFSSDDALEDFNTEATSYLERNKPQEMLLYIGTQNDIFKNPELAHPDSVKGFYINCQNGLEPTISLVIYKEFTADRLHQVGEFATEFASESVVGPELMENELIKKFLELNPIKS
jgi:hypothetical protein